MTSSKMKEKMECLLLLFSNRWERNIWTWLTKSNKKSNQIFKLQGNKTNYQSQRTPTQQYIKSKRNFKKSQPLHPSLPLKRRRRTTFNLFKKSIQYHILFLKHNWLMLSANTSIMKSNWNTIIFRNPWSLVTQFKLKGKNPNCANLKTSNKSSFQWKSFYWKHLTIF